MSTKIQITEDRPAEISKILRKPFLKQDLDPVISQQVKAFYKENKKVETFRFIIETDGSIKFI